MVEISDELLLSQLKKDGLLLKSISKKEQTEQMIEIALKQNPQAIKYSSAKLLTEKVCLRLLKKDGSLLKYVPSKFMTTKICHTAVVNSSIAFNFVPNEIKTVLLLKEKNLELFVKSVGQDVSWIKYIPENLFDLSFCIQAIERNPLAMNLIPESFKSNIEVLRFEKSKGYVTTVQKEYKKDDGRFIVVESVNYCEERSFKVTFGFDDFNSFFEYLKGDLNGAVLYHYDFQGISLNNYNVSGAVIKNEILKNFNLYDDTFYSNMIKDNNVDLKFESILNNDIPVQRKDYYPKPIEDNIYSHNFSSNDRVIFYISDLHLIHRVQNYFPEGATYEEIIWYVRELAHKVTNSIGQIPYNSVLLIGGDIASDFELAKAFYSEISKLWSLHTIVAILGNHELWDRTIKNIDDTKKYRNLLEELGICFLQNDVMIFYNNSVYNPEKIKVYREKQIMLMDENDISDMALSANLVILGGIGFSGYNSEFNATHGIYRDIVSSLAEDVLQTKRFELIYNKLNSALRDDEVIVFTHTPKENWSLNPYNPNWIYVSGHTHKNYLDVTDEHTIYSDNQIGYKGTAVGLKFFTTSRLLDLFRHYCDGIHEISKEQYMAFYSGMNMSMNYRRRTGVINMVKSDRVYMFFLNEKGRTYLLNGGVIRKVEISDLDYYYDNLSLYKGNVEKLIHRFGVGLETVSKFVKSIGGSGRIHGSIIDIDFYNHIYVNPNDGTVTPYFAYSMVEKYVYSDLPSLLKDHCKALYMEYTAMLKTGDVALLPVVCSPKEGNIELSQYVPETDMYKASRIIMQLQYITDKNIVRIWNDALLDYENIERLSQRNNLLEEHN